MLTPINNHTPTGHPGVEAIPVIIREKIHTMVAMNTTGLFLTVESPPIQSMHENHWIFSPIGFNEHSWTNYVNPFQTTLTAYIIMEINKFSAECRFSSLSLAPLEFRSQKMQRQVGNTTKHVNRTRLVAWENFHRSWCSLLLHLQLTELKKSEYL